jgi:RecJ-like exonuclease
VRSLKQPLKKRNNPIIYVLGLTGQANIFMKGKKMTSQEKTCPTCQGKKFIYGQCECNAEWRGTDGDEKVDDCICEPDLECPECKGKGYID